MIKLIDALVFYAFDAFKTFLYSFSYIQLFSTMLKIRGAIYIGKVTDKLLSTDYYFALV